MPIHTYAYTYHPPSTSSTSTEHGVLVLDTTLYDVTDILYFASEHRRIRNGKIHTSQAPSVKIPNLVEEYVPPTDTTGLTHPIAVTVRNRLANLAGT